MGLAKNSVGTFISKSTIFLLRFPISILIARFLGPEGKGLLYLLLTAITMCVSMGNLGLGPASIYFIGKDRTHLPSIVGNLLVITGIIGLSVGIAGGLFLQYGRPDVYEQLPLWVWSIAALLVPLELLAGLLMQVLSAVLRIKEINLINVAAIASRLFLLIFFVVIMEGGIGGAFLAHAFSELLATFGFFLMVLYYGGRPAKPNLALFGASLRFGIKAYLANLMRILNLRLGAFLLTTLAINGVHATGVYSVATNLAELLLFIPASIRLSLFPMVAARGGTEANRLTPAACRHTLLLTLVCSVAMAILGSFVINHLYGEQFATATLPLLILLPGVVMLSQTHVLYGDLIGRGKPEITTISTLLSLIVTVILDLILIPSYGIIGAAMASTCAYTLEFLVIGTFFMRNSGMLWREVLTFRLSDLEHYWKICNSLVSALSTKFFQRSYSSNNPLRQSKKIR